MSSENLLEDSSLALTAHLRVHEACQRFETAWQTWQEGSPPDVNQFLEGIPEPEYSSLLRELLKLDLGYRKQKSLQPLSYQALFPQHMKVIRCVIEEMPSVLTVTPCTADHQPVPGSGAVAPGEAETGPIESPGAAAPPARHYPKIDGFEILGVLDTSHPAAPE